jgi:hypothetical protein
MVEQVRNTTTAWTVASDVSFVWSGTKIVQKRDASTNAILANYHQQREERMNERLHGHAQECGVMSRTSG